MKTLHRLALPALLAFLAASCSDTPQKEQKERKDASVSGASLRAARGTLVDLQTTVVVKALDLDKRLITLEGPRGNVGVYEVGDEVKRLSEIRVGDKIQARYQVAAAAELREATAEEKASPVKIVTASERAPSDKPPAAGIGRAVRVVTTIDALDRSARTLTVKGPLDGIVTLNVLDPAAFDHLQIGQTILVSFGETLVLSVEPGSK